VRDGKHRFRRATRRAWMPEPSDDLCQVVAYRVGTALIGEQRDDFVREYLGSEPFLEQLRDDSPAGDQVHHAE
jgi:hypothetical protein